MNIQPVVLCGGSGTRLWPLSREKHPKQLLALIGDDSLLQATVRRLDGLDSLEADHHIVLNDPIVVSNEEYRFVVAEQMRVIDRHATIVLEPTGRNTAPALTLAALEVNHNDADYIMLVMPADHVMLDKAAFLIAVRKGAELAQQGMVVTFGITPDAPVTSYGYIEAGKPHQGAQRITRFVEKPDLATAQRYLDTGTYLWNSGIFMMRASTWLSAIETCRSDILRACRTAWAQRKADGEFVRVDKDAFAMCPSDSIDYAVMESLAAGKDASEITASLPVGVVVPLNAGWSDVGSWDALWQVLPKDADGNASQGDVLLRDCTNTLAVSEKRLIACVGVSNLIVVETADAILVTHKDATQDVKKVVDSLKAQGRAEGRIHRKVFRPWGWYDEVDAGTRFLVKRIVVKPQGMLSLQMHHHRAEHWIVVRGTARVTRGNDSFLVSENESTFIPLGTRHRLENPGCMPLEMIEVQSGSYLDEDDIVRFDDVYGR
jgi:mannose-1-phosphate guanylyltransferase / mannose-6-phosphate isomerase